PSPILNGRGGGTARQGWRQRMRQSFRPAFVQLRRGKPVFAALRRGGAEDFSLVILREDNSKSNQRICLACRGKSPTGPGGAEHTGRCALTTSANHTKRTGICPDGINN